MLNQDPERAALTLHAACTLLTSTHALVFKAHVLKLVVSQVCI